ncbi:hypothetical protein BDZ97DRAFT_1670599 [Flammula alnicola]|nr:hypothetical protein BDZ97DRAFT_1670599 [Flammula alnicola]
MAITEFASFTASEAYLADSALGDAAVAYLKKAEGIVHGFQVEDKTTAYIVITWDSYESFEKLLKREDYRPFMESMKANLAGPLVVQHIEFEIDSSNAFGAPVTELATMTLKDGHSLEEYSALIAEFNDSEVSQTKGLNPPIAIGKIKQTPGSYFTAVGWDSVEV